MTYRRNGAGTLIAALGMVLAACADSSTGPTETALVVSVVEDTITARAIGGGTWVSSGVTLELRNRSPTDTVLINNCGSIRLGDRAGYLALDSYCPIPADAPGTRILPGQTMTIEWDQLDCPHAQCGLAVDGNVGEYLVRVYYHLEPWFSAKSRMGDYMALSELFAVTLD